MYLSSWLLLSSVGYAIYGYHHIQSIFYRSMWNPAWTGQEKTRSKSWSFDEMPFSNLEARASENQKLPSSVLTTAQDTKDPEVRLDLSWKEGIEFH